MNLGEIEMTKEFVINWHITEACNYQCHFCFAHWEGKDTKDLIKSVDRSLLLIDQIKETFDRVLSKQWGFESLRLNFAGGEPLLYAEQLQEVAAYCQSRGIATSLITNGVYLLEKNFSLQHFDMVGISIDSLSQTRNLKIGRYNRKNEVLDIAKLQAFLQSEKAQFPELDIKINTVVNTENMDEDMSEFINAIAPSRWKVFKMLPVITDMLSISEEQFLAYLERHEAVHARIVSEDNSEMTASYLMIDPIGRFYSNNGAMVSKQYCYSDKILDIGMMPALQMIDFNLDQFLARY